MNGPEAVDPEELADGSTPDADLQVDEIEGGTGGADELDESTGPRDSASREEPPRAAWTLPGLVSPGSTATGAGATT